ASTSTRTSGTGRLCRSMITPSSSTARAAFMRECRWISLRSSAAISRRRCARNRDSRRGPHPTGGQVHRPLGVRAAIVAKILSCGMVAWLEGPGMEPPTYQRRMPLPAGALALEDGLTQAGGVPFALGLAGEPALGGGCIARAGAVGGLQRIGRQVV